MRAHRIRRLTTLAAAVLIIQAVLPLGVLGAEPRGPARVGTDRLAHDSWIVTLVPGADARGEAAAMAAAAGGRAGLVYRHAFQGFQLEGSAEAAEALRRNPRVASVEADRAVYLTETLPFGIERIGAYDPASSEGAYQQGFRGAGARVAILDTGIDLDHPDLVNSIDQALGLNCVTAGAAPEDGYGHGTHVAGTAVNPRDNVGLVGVATDARLVAVKMFDDAGNSSEARALCAIDHIIGLQADADPGNDVDVANMSWGEDRAWGDCAADALHRSICAAHAAGIILVAGAGNASVDAGSFVPAAFPEVISVSALADFDGDPGGLAGCAFVPSLFWYECDDTFALFSNFGASVDIIAPGVAIHSTWTGGGYRTIDGTSMATPHVAGTVALMAAASPGLTPARALELLATTGECPNGQAAADDGAPGCAGQGAWPDDPDGAPEPLVNALRAAQAAAGEEPPPPPPPPDPVAPGAPTLSAEPGDALITLSWTAPDPGSSPISGYEVYRGTSAGDATLLTLVGAVPTSYDDSTAANGTTYWYQVAAVNDDAGVGARSNEVSATPQASGPVATGPGAPERLRASKLRSGDVELRWVAPSSDGGSPILEYRIYRRSDGGTFSLVDAVPGNTRSFVDDSVAARTWYTYEVRAVNGVGAGPPAEVRIRSG